MTCAECEQIEKREGMVLYSDPQAHVILPEKPAVKGHVRIFSKNHAERTEELSEDDMQHLLTVANIASGVLFEALGAHGTNIIMNEEGHIHLDVIARKEDDGVSTTWSPKQIDEAKLEQLRDRIESSMVPAPRESIEPAPKPPAEKMQEDNPMIEHLKKLP